MLDRNIRKGRPEMADLKTPAEPAAQSGTNRAARRHPEMEVDQLLTTEQTATVLNVPPATLRWWRHQRTGPKAFRLGARKVMYKLSDVVEWREQQYNAVQVTAAPMGAA
jgi:predicted DNA-binding transcriptional regulator AlpA